LEGGIFPPPSPSGGTGRRAGLKILSRQRGESSILSSGTPSHTTHCAFQVSIGVEPLRTITREDRCARLQSRCCCSAVQPFTFPASPRPRKSPRHFPSTNRS